MNAVDRSLLPRFLNGWRIAGWGAALALLLLPAIAMQFTDDVVWTRSDFVFAAIMLLALGAGAEIAFRVGRSGPQRIGLIVAALAGFVTLWGNAAVGMIGDGSARVNMGFDLLVIGAAIASALVWFRPYILRWIFALVAVGQPVLGLMAERSMPGHGVEWGIIAVFAAIWAFAALCFHRAARTR